MRLSWKEVRKDARLEHTHGLSPKRHRTTARRYIGEPTHSGKPGSESEVTIALQQLPTHVQEPDKGAWLRSVKEVEVAPLR